MKLTIVIPVFNEERNLPESLEALNAALVSVPEIEPELLFVDDGSRDGTLAYLRALAHHDPRVRVISFSRNFGSHPALMSAFRHCTGDAVAYLSADGQDPPELLLQMVARWREGCQVVWGVRESRDDALVNVLFSTMYSRSCAGSRCPTCREPAWMFSWRTGRSSMPCWACRRRTRQ